MHMDKDWIIAETVSFVQAELKDAEGGHDWWHINRVWNNAKKIAKQEGGKLIIVELGALLHDIADYKFHNGDENVGPQKAKDFLTKLGLDADSIHQVEQIIKNVSYKGGSTERTYHSLELDIVQDADRLDAIGAIGIARTFNYGGFKNRAMYDPNIEPKLNMSKEEYKKSNDPTLNHFYEKLFRLKELMNTRTAKALSEDRHAFMEEFVLRFKKEFAGI